MSPVGRVLVVSSVPSVVLTNRYLAQLSSEECRLAIEGSRCGDSQSNIRWNQGNPAEDREEGM